MENNHLEPLVEALLAKELGWDLDAFRGQKPLKPIGERPKYRILEPSKYAPGSRPAYLRLVAWQSFGNAVEQLQNAFAVGQAVGAHTIVWPDHEFFEGERVGEFRLIRSREELPAGFGIEGMFYYLEPFGLRLSRDEQLQLVQDYVRPLVTNRIMGPDPRVRPDDLVLHFRAGDVFSNPHPLYGQPPLAYYLAAVDREQPHRVWLVFEDRANPTIDAAEAAIRARGVGVMVQSGHLESDLRVLLSAQRLVVGVGTFGLAVSMLSPRLRRLYLFQGWDGWDYVTPPSEIQVVRARDARGHYVASIMSQNWAGTPAQRDLMLSYPSEAIDFL